jgi:hypothetical protein
MLAHGVKVALFALAAGQIQGGDVETLAGAQLRRVDDSPGVGTACGLYGQFRHALVIATTQPVANRVIPVISASFSVQFVAMGCLIIP